MNQTEIYQNMTKGEWSNHHGSIYRTTGRLLLMRSGQVTDTESVANGELILMMKRETIDKGINPESVEKMKNVLTWIANADPKTTPSWMIHDAKEALTSAKL